MTGKGVRVYIVDTGVQGSHVDFTGRVVNGHTVGALLVAAHIYADRTRHPYNTTRPSTPSPPDHRSPPHPRHTPFP
jgi:subtilisin family serine protease